MDRDAAREVIEWIEQRHVVRLSETVRALLVALLTHQHRELTLDVLFERLSISGSTLSNRLHKKLLPNPRRWIQLARGLELAEVIHAEPTTSITEIAQRLGYRDHSYISHQLKRSFGVRFGQVRERQGTMWLLERWWSRHGSLSAKNASFTPRAESLR